MPSAWGKAWGSAWGAAWGATQTVQPGNNPGAYSYNTGGGFSVPRLRLEIAKQHKRRARKRRDNDILFLSH